MNTLTKVAKETASKVSEKILPKEKKSSLTSRVKVANFLAVKFVYGRYPSQHNLKIFVYTNE